MCMCGRVRVRVRALFEPLCRAHHDGRCVGVAVQEVDAAREREELRRKQEAEAQARAAEAERARQEKAALAEHAIVADDYLEQLRSRHKDVDAQAERERLLRRAKVNEHRVKEIKTRRILLKWCV